MKIKESRSMVMYSVKDYLLATSRPSKAQIVSGTDMLRQLYVLPH